MRLRQEDGKFEVCLRSDLKKRSKVQLGGKALV